MVATAITDMVDSSPSAPVITLGTFLDTTAGTFHGIIAGTFLDTTAGTFHGIIAGTFLRYNRGYYPQYNRGSRR